MTKVKCLHSINVPPNKKKQKQNKTKQKKKKKKRKKKKENNNNFRFKRVFFTGFNTNIHVYRRLKTHMTYE